VQVLLDFKELEDLLVTRALRVLQDLPVELDLLDPQDLGETQALWEVRVLKVFRV